MEQSEKGPGFRAKVSRAALAANIALPLTLLMLDPGQALAQAPDQSSERVVLMGSFGGEAPERALEMIGRMAQNTGSSAMLSGQALADAIDARMSRTAQSKGEVKGLVLQVKDGHRQFIEGHFDEAKAELEQARSLLLAAVGRVASDQSLREALHTSLLMLAHTYLRQGQGDLAVERVSEAIRSFPDRDLSMVQYSPELVEFYKKVRRDMDRQQRGTLTVNTLPAGCMVFVNERYVGMSPARVADLYPGRYRVFVQRPQQQGRIHGMVVHGGDHTITIDFELDLALHTDLEQGKGQVLLRYDSSGKMQQEQVGHAAAVARAVGAAKAMVVGVREHQGRDVLMGVLVSADTGQEVRSGWLSMGPAPISDEELGNLGRFLLSGECAGGVSCGTGKAPAGQAEMGGGGSEGTSVMGVLKWVTLGVAVGALGAGIPLLALDGQGTCDAPEGVRCPEYYQTMEPGAVLVAVGGAAAAASVVLFILDARRTRARSLEESMVLPGLMAGPGAAGLAVVGMW